MIRRHLHTSDDSSESEDERNYNYRRKNYKVRINFQLNDDFDYKESFRLSREQVQVHHVLAQIGNRLERVNDRNKALTAEQQLKICLHWLGNGAQYHGVANMHGVSKSTICRVVNKVTQTIIDVMFQNTIRWPENIYLVK